MNRLKAAVSRPAEESLGGSQSQKFTAKRCTRHSVHFTIHPHRNHHSDGQIINSFASSPGKDKLHSAGKFCIVVFLAG